MRGWRISTPSRPTCAARCASTRSSGRRLPSCRSRLSLAQPQRLDAAAYRDLVTRALVEDLAGGDITTDAIFSPHDRARATFLANSACTIAGLDVALEAFSQLDAAVDATWHFRD